MTETSTARRHRGLPLAIGALVIAGAMAACAVEQPTEAGLDPPLVVVVRPGDVIQRKVDSAPPGTRFLIKAGVHRRQQIFPKGGNTFVGEPGAILDGEHAVPYAFDGVTPGPPYPDNVTIRGLVIRAYQGPLQSAAVLAGHMWKPDAVTYGWVIEDNEVTGNAAGGIRIGTRSRVRRNLVHHNGQIGISGVGDSTLVADNEIAWNNTAGVDAGWEAGGAKFVLTNDLVVRGNFIHHNAGIGLWSDISSHNTLFEDNRVEDNAFAGIFVELGYGAIIRNNVVQRNGFSQGEPAWVLSAGIMLANSSDVEIYGNTVVGNRQGITAYHQVRGVTPFEQSMPKPYGPWTTRNNYIHDNDITMTVGMTGMAQDVDLSQDLFLRWNNRFTNNRYLLGATNTLPFAWGNSPLTAEQWISAGQDIFGSFSVAATGARRAH
ncbi:MAG: nitrous oxide reductase family maturation protein NosD [Gemmatimonadales bacterium]